MENKVWNFQIIRGRRAQLGDEGSSSAAGDRADHPGQRGLHHARTLRGYNSPSTVLYYVASYL